MKENEMKYSRSMSSNMPGLVMILIDQSRSMQEECPSYSNMTKANILSLNVNRVLAELCLRNTKDVMGKPQIKPRIDVSVIGYGHEPKTKEIRVESAFGGKLSGKMIISLPEIAGNYIRLETYQEGDNRGTTKIPIWIEPQSVGQTPMGAAFRKATEVLENWVSTHKASFPPVVLNFTDGEVNDVSPRKLSKIVKRLTKIETNDGAVLLFNCHISSGTGISCMLPSDISEVPKEESARLMFEMSSKFPSLMQSLAKGRGFPDMNDETRGFAYNVDVANFVHFLQIGTVGLSERRG